MELKGMTIVPVDVLINDAKGISLHGHLVKKKEAA